MIILLAVRVHVHVYKSKLINKVKSYMPNTLKTIPKLKLEMCQYNTDAHTQGPALPRDKHFAKHEVEKGP